MNCMTEKAPEATGEQNCEVLSNRTVPKTFTARVKRSKCGLAASTLTTALPRGVIYLSLNPALLGRRPFRDAVQASAVRSEAISVLADVAAWSEGRIIVRANIREIPAPTIAKAPEPTLFTLKANGMAPVFYIETETRDLELYRKGTVCYGAPLRTWRPTLNYQPYFITSAQRMFGCSYVPVYEIPTPAAPAPDPLIEFTFVL